MEFRKKDEQFLIALNVINVIELCFKKFLLIIIVLLNAFYVLIMNIFLSFFI